VSPERDVTGGSITYDKDKDFVNILTWANRDSMLSLNGLSYEHKKKALLGGCLTGLKGGVKEGKEENLQPLVHKLQAMIMPPIRASQ
jgi:hypothetical protein